MSKSKAKRDEYQRMRRKKIASVRTGEEPFYDNECDDLRHIERAFSYSIYGEGSFSGRSPHDEHMYIPISIYVHVARIYIHTEPFPLPREREHTKCCGAKKNLICRVPSTRAQYSFAKPQSFRLSLRSLFFRRGWSKSLYFSFVALQLCFVRSFSSLFIRVLAPSFRAFAGSAREMEIRVKFI